MDCPPELEKAEAELQASLRKERARTQWSLADGLIGLAAIIHFLWGVACVLGFILLTLAKLVIEGQELSGWLWLAALPVGTASLGVACALVRVLELTPIRRDRATKASPRILNQ